MEKKHLWEYKQPFTDVEFYADDENHKIPWILLYLSGKLRHFYAVQWLHEIPTMGGTGGFFAKKKLTLVPNCCIVVLLNYENAVDDFLMAQMKRIVSKVTVRDVNKR